MTDPWSREHQPFNFSATGYLGRKRPGMLNNHLLQRSRLGHGKGSGVACPQTELIGNSYRSPFTVAHALTGWAGGALLPPQEQFVHPRKRAPGDFLQYNWGATSMGVSTREEQQAYRQTRKYIPMIFYGPPAEMIVRPPPVTIKPETVYGIKSIRNKESLTDLLTYTYHKQWYLEAKREAKVKEIKKPNFQRIRPNMATKLRHIEINARTTQLPAQPRHLPQHLANVKPHLSTFPSERARQKAWDAHLKEKAEMEGKPTCQISRHKQLPLFQQLPSIQDFHLCPPHGPSSAAESSVLEKHELAGVNSETK